MQTNTFIEVSTKLILDNFTRAFCTQYTHTPTNLKVLFTCKVTNTQEKISRLTDDTVLDSVAHSLFCFTNKILAQTGGSYFIFVFRVHFCSYHNFCELRLCVFE